MRACFRQRLLRCSARDEVPAHLRDVHDANFGEPVVIQMPRGSLGRLSAPKPCRTSICVGACFRQRLLRGSAHNEVSAHCRDVHDGNFDEPVVKESIFKMLLDERTIETDFRMLLGERLTDNERSLRPA